MEEAIVVTARPGIPAPGQSLIISDLTKAYPNHTSESINYRGFACKDCGAPCLAVIPAKHKPGRQRSQRAYFRAESKHLERCNTGKKKRAAVSTTATGSSRSTVETCPTVWRAAPATTSTSSIDAGGGKPAHGTTSSPINGGSGAGAGRSIRGSSLVEEFATHWLGMTSAERQTIALKAPWNAGGTYASAFHELAAGDDLATIGIRIYVGTIASAKSVPSGWLLIASVAGNALPVEFWVKSAALVTQPGQKLAAKLANVSAGSSVFALGAFRRQNISKLHTFTLPVESHAEIWIS